MAKVVVVGDFHAALSVHAERLPRPHQTVGADDFVTIGGGRGTVQAVTAARLGAAVTFIGRVGDDLNAEVAAQLFAGEGISEAHLFRDLSTPTGVTLTFTDPDDKTLRAYVPGANHHLTTADIERARAALTEADVLITQLGVPLEAVGRALEIACENNVTSVLKPTPFTPIPPEILALVDFVTPNEDELRALALNVAQKQKPPHQVTVCTLGAQGAQWFRRENNTIQTGRVPGFPVRTVDVSGAGDVFSAALGVATAEGHDFKRAIRFANAAAALSTTQRGGVTSVPARAAVEQKLRDTTEG
jgi:ribokinase